MIQELVQYIATQATLTIGTDIHTGWWPQREPDNCSVVREFGGEPMVLTGQARGVALFQIVSRGTSYFTARALALAIYEVLRIKGKIVLPIVTSGDPAFIVEQMNPQGRPQWVGEDENRRHQFSFTLHCFIKEA